LGLAEFNIRNVKGDRQKYSEGKRKKSKKKASSKNLCLKRPAGPSALGRAKCSVTP